MSARTLFSPRRPIENIPVPDPEKLNDYLAQIKQHDDDKTIESILGQILPDRFVRSLMTTHVRGQLLTIISPQLWRREGNDFLSREQQCFDTVIDTAAKIPGLGDLAAHDVSKPLVTAIVKFLVRKAVQHRPIAITHPPLTGGALGRTQTLVDEEKRKRDEEEKRRNRDRQKTVETDVGMEEDTRTEDEEEKKRRQREQSDLIDIDMDVYEQGYNTPTRRKRSRSTRATSHDTTETTFTPKRARISEAEQPPRQPFLFDHFVIELVDCTRLPIISDKSIVQIHSRTCITQADDVRLMEQRPNCSGVFTAESVRLESLISQMNLSLENSGIPGFDGKSSEWRFFSAIEYPHLIPLETQSLVTDQVCLLKEKQKDFWAVLIAPKASTVEEFKEDFRNARELVDKTLNNMIGEEEMDVDCAISGDLG
ncbi:unnamed protein product [Periconia digitata]|uniref:Uncharacterized protein n=1 Tax=Periconia digitata TaxID=1303443 RepID=A0A9W4U3F7_9PLEO|nr:unnamed protein product [Periconia digitata]